ncbi:MAG: NADH-quinone oxidoreductase subunit M, partial [bacterium]
VRRGYVTALAVFSLSSLAFPGTNSFVGEFLVLAGTFAFSGKVAFLAVPGVILGAAYMLRMIQRIIWGGVNNPDTSFLKDLNPREMITLAPLLALVLWIGLAPTLFLDTFHVSVAHLLQQFHAGLNL